MHQRIIKRNQIPVPHWFLHMIKPLAMGLSEIQAMLPSMTPFSHEASTGLRALSTACRFPIHSLLHHTENGLPNHFIHQNFVFGLQESLYVRRIINCNSENTQRLEEKYIAGWLLLEQQALSNDDHESTLGSNNHHSHCHWWLVVQLTSHILFWLQTFEGTL